MVRYLELNLIENSVIRLIIIHWVFEKYCKKNLVHPKKLKPKNREISNLLFIVNYFSLQLELKSQILSHCIATRFHKQIKAIRPVNFNQIDNQPDLHLP